MRKIDEPKLLEYIQGTTEGRKLEFKPSLDWDDPNSKKLKEEIIKSIIAFSNIPTGGTIILGIDHRQDGSKIRYSLSGVSQVQINWIDEHYEQIEKQVQNFCSEPPNFEFVWGATNKLDKMGKTLRFILVIVNEFVSLPIICSTTGSQKEENKIDYVLREGDIYTRSYRANWSSKRCTAKELEEIIKLTADKHRQELKLRGYVKLDDLVVKLKEERSEYE
jgi:hypothetical protein